MNRRFLCLPVLLLLLGACVGAGQRPVRPAGAGAPGTKPYFVYVGTSTGDPTGGIHVLRFDPADGSLTRAPVAVTRILNPSFLALAPDGRTLYAVSEVEDGAVAAFRRDSTGALRELDRRSSGGAGPAYVAVSASGRWLTVANYGGGSVALLPIDEDGALGDPIDVVQHKGSGPNPDRQKGPHAHFAKPSPDDRWVFVADLGIDQVITYPVGGNPVRLNAARAVVTRSAPGAGPRHLAFHPDRPFIYLMSELAGTVTAYGYDAQSGQLSEIQTISALPEGFHGRNGSADIHVHPNGRWLYASNRGDFDSIAIFAIDAETGRLTPLGHQREGIVWPRNFVIEPTGRWLLVGNQRGNEVRVYAIDTESGRLRPTPNRVSVPGPTNVLLTPGP